VIADEQATLQFYTYNYPGWRVTIDGRPVFHRSEPPHGLITLTLPPGEHVVHLRMGSTPARSLGAVLSGVALLAVIGLYVSGRKEKTPDS
jgi:hypothetical protein